MSTVSIYLNFPRNPGEGFNFCKKSLAEEE